MTYTLQRFEHILPCKDEQCRIHRWPSLRPGRIMSASLQSCRLYCKSRLPQAKELIMKLPIPLIGAPVFRQLLSHASCGWFFLHVFCIIFIDHRLVLVVFLHTNLLTCVRRAKMREYSSCKNSLITGKNDKTTLIFKYLTGLDDPHKSGSSVCSEVNRFFGQETSEGQGRPGEWSCSGFYWKTICWRTLDKSSSKLMRAGLRKYMKIFHMQSIKTPAPKFHLVPWLTVS